MIKLTTEQQAVYQDILDFLRAPTPRRPYYVLNGLAGTGKTTMLSHLANQIPHALVCAFTGKAASVLTRKMHLSATTIHSAIYRFLGLNDAGDPVFRDKIQTGEWAKNIVLLDEHSTVGAFLASDLLNTGARVVACGDPGQLPPVRDQQFFNVDPDAVLHTIHRQALNSPIIRQAHQVRTGEPYHSDGEDFQIIQHITQPLALSADIVLCYRNKTRHWLNDRLREYRGINPTSYPQPLEPVMCLRNDHRRAVLNGAIYTVENYLVDTKRLIVKNERGELVSLQVAIETLDPPPDPELDRKIIPFAFGYAATVHKFQGSEADIVILVDEYDKRHERERFLYTAITRAAKRIIVQRWV